MELTKTPSWSAPCRHAGTMQRAFSHSQGFPAAGLYHPDDEHDSCGVALVATLRGVPGHDVVEYACESLSNMEHRGAVGTEPGTGDGAGIMTHIPHGFFKSVMPFELPEPGRYAVGLCFLPADDPDGAADRIADICRAEGLTVVGWREVPVDADVVGATAKGCMPHFRQLVVSHPTATGVQLQRIVYCARKQAERVAYICSLSTTTVVYKGMLTTAQLPEFFPDLQDPRYASEVAIVHSRFSTNTFPSWPLAQPFRYVAHNGEINTVRGNRNWMRTRESLLASDVLPGSLDRLLPICSPGASDSASFDEVLELYHMAGRSLPHAVLMMIPQAWENHTTMDPAVKAFYEYHAMFTEPWDGPANVVFCDGRFAGAVLDRNGLRPARYITTSDDLVILASEAGTVPLADAQVTLSGRLKPGEMFLLDLHEGRVVSDQEVKQELAAARPFQQWLDNRQIKLDELPEREHVAHTKASVRRRQQTFGYTEEELKLIIEPMAQHGVEPIGSMGTDTPVAVLSTRPRLLFDYFVQLFAQVTNPPLDAIREDLVTSLSTALGPAANVLADTPMHCRQVVLASPVIDNDQLAKIANLNRDGDRPRFATTRVQALYRAAGGADELARRVDEICAQVSAAIVDGARFIIVSDRDSDADLAPIPSLLITAAVHHHLIRERTRTQVGLLIEAGDVRQVHHVACLVGYGAAVVNPYLAMESAEDLCRPGRALAGMEPERAVANLLAALSKGLLKVMSKMGISTVASYRGAQVFEALGLSQDVVDRYFTGTRSQLGGVALDVVAAECAARHLEAYPATGVPATGRELMPGGQYQWRRDGEDHVFDPETIHLLQRATKERRADLFARYSTRVNDSAHRLMTLRGLFSLAGQRPPIPLSQVESRESIMRRFSTGAMSYGSISAEAHETLAIAMNQIGGRSNSGEGGETLDRLVDPQRRSAIKQVASGRFGVTSWYLASADDIQIKMAQGAKPGEGGQLPGNKVYPWVASTRHSTPGVSLISPPPHHDIYSIEDLAQLIYDLKNANPKARIHVKLVAQSGIGPVAAGVAKAHADVILISGHDGGTGASPLTSLKHAGGPWELGLAQAQQTLLQNGLRDRVVVQCDGGLRTGRDVVIAALLGAEEFGFATAPLIAAGCVMMRVCHLDTCPVGIATQNPQLRERYTGTVAAIVAFFEFIADEVRELLAQLGCATLADAVGQVQCVDSSAAVSHWKAQGLDVAPLLARVPVVEGGSLRCTRSQDHGLAGVLDRELIAQCGPALRDKTPVRVAAEVSNTDRSVGTMLGYEVSSAWGAEGLPEHTIAVDVKGVAGQSLGAFLPKGITLTLRGMANDYVGKGLSGGTIVLTPSQDSPLAPYEHVIAGNTLAYGATSGDLFAYGLVGERFGVRNSGAVVVAEGVGDHGCEYMTGGAAVVLGPVGRNFAAGMSGGVAFVWDCDPEQVNVSARRGGQVSLVPVAGEYRDQLREILTRYGAATGSSTAASILADFEQSVGRFLMVVPKQFAAVTQIVAQATARGDSAADVWSSIMEVQGG